MDVKVIVTAGGTGVRFGGYLPKQFMLLGTKPVLYHAIKTFESCSFVTEIAVVVPPAHMETVMGFGFLKVNHYVPGKETRAGSVYEALQRFSSGIVLIHDGVRPIVKKELVRNVAHAAFTHGAAIAATRVTDTIKKSDEQGFVSATVERQDLWRASTPQGFKTELLHDAFRMAIEGGYMEGATDEAFLVEKLGKPVFLVKGPGDNIKITYPQDLKIAEALLENCEA